MNTYFVTGGAGFIGSHMLELLLERKSPEDVVVCVDDLREGSNYENLPKAELYHPNFKFIKCDISNAKDLSFNFDSEIRPFTHIVHLAAESHVDRSINNSDPFIQSNIVGTYNLLECMRKYSPNAIMVYVSTDEVYGELKSKHDKGFTEVDILNPRSPYSASKAAGEMLVSAWKATYDLDIRITRCCNNYGPCQADEKFIPTVLKSLFMGKKVPVYGDGTNVREWIYVKDHCNAIYDVLHQKFKIRCVNIGSQEKNVYSNLELIKLIIDYMHAEGYLDNCDLDKHIEFIEDRKGHDFCYMLDTIYENIVPALKQQKKFSIGLLETINFYREYYMEQGYNQIMKSDFQQGQFLIEYRQDAGGVLKFVREKIDDLDRALKVAADLKDKGFSDVLIRKNENKEPK